MAYVSLKDNKNRIEINLTDNARRALSLGKTSFLKIASFSLSDYDINYNLAEQISVVTSFVNVPLAGNLPSLTGQNPLSDKNSICLGRLSKGLNDYVPTIPILEGDSVDPITGEEIDVQFFFEADIIEECVKEI